MSAEEHPSQETAAPHRCFCSKDLHIPESKFEVLLFLKEKKLKIKNTPMCFVHVKKRFRATNTACKEKRGECVLFDGKNSCCLGQIETRWEGIRRAKLKHVLEKDIRDKMCSQGRGTVPP